jgi:transposase-like protein
MWLVVCEKNGISAMGLQRQLGLSRYETAWSVLKKLRAAMVRPGRELLSGDVEVDETLVGGSKSGKRGRGAEGKELVVIAAEVKNKKVGRIRMKRISNADGETLKSFVKDHVSSGSTVITDGWKSYLGIEKFGYTHQRIKGESVGIDELLPHIHLVASLLKRWLLGTHQGGVDTIHLDAYLDEFVFRFNRRTSKSRGKLFYRLVQQAVQVPPSR